jgi:hypothetical protein
MASHVSLLAELASSIATNAKKVEDYLVENNLPEPSFDIDAPVEYESYLKDPAIRAAQSQLANDSKKLHLLMAGHAETMKTQGMRVSFISFPYILVLETDTFSLGFSMQANRVHCGFCVTGMLQRMFPLTVVSAIPSSRRRLVSAKTCSLDLFDWLQLNISSKRRSLGLLPTRLARSSWRPKLDKR